MNDDSQPIVAMPTPPTPPMPPTPPADTTEGTSTAAPVTTSDDDDASIPEFVKSEYPDLVTLIKKTESMDADEKNYWFQIIPVMTESQIENLRTILTDEAKQLALLDKEYQDELSKLNDTHASQWNAQEAMQAKQALKEAEAAANAEEQATEADILNQLDNL